MPEDRIGVISDTHGLLRPEAVDALKDSSLIIHAGDIGNPEVLEALKQVAPVVAVRGNIDKEAWCRSLPLSQTVEFGHKKFYLIHDLSTLDLDPGAAGFDGVIFGHSHQSSIKTRDGVIYLNPGSAGPKRFKLPVCVARIELEGNVLKPQLIELKIRW